MKDPVFIIQWQLFKVKSVLSVLLLYLLTGCSNNDSIGPNMLIPGSDDLKEMVNYQLLSEDSLELYSSESAKLAGKYFSYIIISNKNGPFENVPLDTIVPIYKKSDNAYLMQFSKTIRVSNSQAFCELELKFILNDHDYQITDLLIELYKYPFKSSELLFDLRASCLEIGSTGFIQGFDFYHGDLYFHMSGPSGIYKFNNKNCETVVGDYSSGDWICIYNDKLYIDFSHARIGVTDIGSNQKIPYLIENTNWDIMGMDIDNDTLYVLNWDYSGRGMLLSKFNLDGTFISDEPFNYDGWSLSISNGYLYTLTQPENDIIRYNIQTKEYETVNTHIPGYIQSIKIVDVWLYYADTQKNIICYLPLNEIFTN